MKRKKQKEEFYSTIPFMEIKNTCSQNTTNYKRLTTNKIMHIKHIRMTTFNGRK